MKSRRRRRVRPTTSIRSAKAASRPTRASSTARRASRWCSTSSGRPSRRAGGVRGHDTTQTYIRVKLSHPVPADGGEARVLILKTYEDAVSYHWGRIPASATDRESGARNRLHAAARHQAQHGRAPAGLRADLVQLSVAGAAAGRRPRGDQFLERHAGRGAAHAPRACRRPASALRRPAFPGVAARLDERAHQNRKIVYFLQQPETHAFDLYHDYTESRPGTSTYINEVRGGSTVSKPSARNLDTGEELKWEVRERRRHHQGEATRSPTSRRSRRSSCSDFAPVQAGAVGPHPDVRDLHGHGALQARRAGADVGPELRPPGRTRSSCPKGWILTNSSVPATVSEQPTAACGSTSSTRAPTISPC